MMDLAIRYAEELNLDSKIMVLINHIRNFKKISALQISWYERASRNA